jgi:excisionase family DNA binding protein
MRPPGVEPGTPGFEGRIESMQEGAESCKPLQSLGIVEGSTCTQMQPGAREIIRFAPPLLRKQASKSRVRSVALARPALLTVAEVAAELRVSKATVYGLVEQGQLPHKRVLNSIRIAATDFEDFLSGRSTGSPAKT